MKIGILMAGVGGLVLLLGARSEGPQTPWIVYNHSPSVALGWYRWTNAEPQRHRLIVFKAPQKAVTYSEKRWHERPSEDFIKPVVATGGDKVCERNHQLFIDGRVVAPVVRRGPTGLSLPHWTACRQLQPGEYFTLSTRVPNSFDSRYFGPVNRSAIIGVYAPLWPF